MAFAMRTTKYIAFITALEHLSFITTCTPNGIHSTSFLVLSGRGIFKSCRIFCSFHRWSEQKKTWSFGKTNIEVLLILQKNLFIFLLSFVDSLNKAKASLTHTSPLSFNNPFFLHSPYKVVQPNVHV
jgi:hypothetical protein